MRRTDPPAFLRRMESPIGTIELGGDGAAVISVSMERDGHVPWEHLPERTDAVLDHAAQQLAEYFAGDRRSFDVPVSFHGTPFQVAIWEQLAALEFGEVVSYGELGRATGRATAGRAVGGAVGANPVPLLIPCHRVLGTDGRITGYSGGNGIPTKSWLLRHEGIAHSVPRDSGPVELDLPAA